MALPLTIHCVSTVTATSGCVCPSPPITPLSLPHPTTHHPPLSNPPSLPRLPRTPTPHPQVPPSRISGMSASELRAAVHRDVQALLGSSDRLRALLNSLCVPPVAGGTLQVWLMSVLEAADLVLWVDVSTPGVCVWGGWLDHMLRDECGLCF
jgi:hypothetical protein